MKRLSLARFALVLICALAAGSASAQAPGGPRGGFGGRGGRGGGAGRNLIGVVSSIGDTELTFRRQGGRGITEIVVPIDKDIPVSRLKPMKLVEVKEPSWARVRGFAAPNDPDSLAATLITIAPKMPDKTDGAALLGITSGVMTVAGETTATLKVGDKSLRLIIDVQTLVYGETPAKLSDLKVGDNIMVNPKDDSGAVFAESLFILPEGDLPALGGRRGGARGGRGGRGGRGRGGGGPPPINSIDELV